MTDNHALAFASVADLAQPAALSRLLGQVDRVERLPLGQLGNSGAIHERLRVWLGCGEQACLILKCVDLKLDITAIRSGDHVGREARLVQEPRLAAVWSVFENPYRASAAEPGHFGMLFADPEAVAACERRSGAAAPCVAARIEVLTAAAARKALARAGARSRARAGSGRP